MPDDEKKKVTSLPPPTDDVDKDWSRPSGTPPEPKVSKSSSEPSAKKPASDPKSDLKPPWKKKEKVEVRDDDDDDEDEDDDDDDDAVDEDAVDEDEDEDDDDEDEDDDDDDDDRRKAPAAKAKAKERGPQRASDRKTPAPSAVDDWLPDWSPWAVLGGLIFLGFLGGFGLLPIDFNLKPSAAPEASALPTTSSAPTTRPDASALRETMRERRRRAMAADAGATGAMIRASHLLVGFQGSSLPNQTRSKTEARARAEEALKKAKKGEDFAKVVATYTDEPGGAQRGGDLNRFGRGRMVPAFEEAAFALKPNEISGVVETQFGFHVIKRTE
jgi:peptidyl-prolyl cis-trans isomerase NIMA-interacting 1